MMRNRKSNANKGHGEAVELQRNPGETAPIWAGGGISADTLEL